MPLEAKTRHSLLYPNKTLIFEIVISKIIRVDFLLSIITIGVETTTSFKIVVLEARPNKLHRASQTAGSKVRFDQSRAPVLHRVGTEPLPMSLLLHNDLYTGQKKISS
jgi:hypothetical protein